MLTIFKVFHSLENMRLENNFNFFTVIIIFPCSYSRNINVIELKQGLQKRLHCVTKGQFLYYGRN